MNRQNWLFNYDTKEILTAAQAKILKHQAKLEWWEKKKEETMAKVREGGIEVQDSVAASYSNTKGAFGPRVVIDETLQRDLSECQGKIMQHYDSLNDYKSWEKVLSGTHQPVLELDHADYLFFFGE